MSVANDQRPRILIVDDDPVMLCLVDDYLERHNMRAVLSSRA
jgi:CheY-like chemotaxis protein